MSNLPPGYRFYPTEEELVGFYLRNKLDRRREDIDRLIPVVDIYSLDPWELPSILGEGCNGDEQWFFFSPRQEREAQGGRPNRITPSGYWKATGTPGYVFSSDNRKMGVKRTMVFYQGKAPTGNKTKWKLNEYKALEESTTSSATPKARHEVSLCRVYVTSGSVRSFDRRPMVAATGETLHREDSTPMSGVSNNEGASGSNSSGLAQENPSMEEQVGHLYPSPVEETGDDLNMLDDLDDLWNSFTWD